MIRRTAVNAIAVRGRIMLLPEWFMFAFKQYHCVRFRCPGKVRKFATYCEGHRHER